ncbi:MAG TPA: pyridoxamine kinase [Oscillospiraceae bacterium]|nr:pyridoxamine kinase [Oscillospiraceae bacterium]
METQKRLVAINDISGFGKCSLTVAIPVISACGIETVCLPTAILSTHTGGFSGYTFRDLTEDMVPFINHWKSLKLEFDAIYSGFLGSIKQIEIVKNFFDTFKRKDTITIVDPSMADHGKLYSVFDMEFAREMTQLSAVADIVIPNITEAAFMTNTEYIGTVQTKQYIEQLLEKILSTGAKSVVLTGVSFDEKKLGVACKKANDSETQYYFTKRIDGHYHGTGDVFASAFSGALLNKFSLYDSSRIAANYVLNCIERTRQFNIDMRYGVDFERGIPFLLGELGL